MISQENIDKFNKVISHYNLSETSIKDLGRAVCVSDMLYGSNDKQLSVKRLANSGVDIFKSLSQSKAEPLPDVQVMRVMCDTLYFALLIEKGSGMNKIGIHLTSEASNYIGKGIRKNGQILDPGSKGYSDMDECQKVLDLYCSFSDFDESEYDDIFKYVSESLGRFRHLLSIIDKTHFLAESQFESVYLPDSYDTHDYKVTTSLPKALQVVPKGAMREQIEYWELSKMMDLFILFLAGTKQDSIYRNAFVNKLVKINNRMKDLLPIGVGGSSGVRRDIYRPAKMLNNPALNNLYDLIFSKQYALSRNSIDSMFKVCVRLYDIKEDI